MGPEISVDEVRFVAFEIARQNLSFDQPIPDFETRSPNILESCLATPFQVVFGRPLYVGLVSRASMLFYLLIKNHPFQNGNKRIAIVTLLLFLAKHKKWLRVEMRKLYNFTVKVAASKAQDKDFVLMAIEGFLARGLARYPAMVAHKK